MATSKRKKATLKELRAFVRELAERIKEGEVDREGNEHNPDGNDEEIDLLYGWIGDARALAGYQPNVEIDPARFSSAEWEEAYNVDDEGVLPCEQHDLATTVTEHVDRVRALATACFERAKEVRTGPLNDAEWARDLRQAGTTLKEIANGN